MVYYTYAVTRAREPSGSWALPVAGIANAPVYGVSYRDVAAITSPVPEALMVSLQEEAWFGINVLAHHQVLVALLDRYTLVPFKFGTVYRGEARVQEMLARHYQDLVETLVRLDGATEWGVKLYCDRNVLMQWIRKRNEQVRQMDEEASRRPEGAAYFLRKKLEQLAWREAVMVVDARIQESHQQLAGLAREAVTNPVQPAGVNGRRGEMLLNGAYLVDDDRSREAFRAAVTALEEVSAPQGFGYEQTGPWPPYNFVAAVFEEASGDPAGT